MRLTLVVALARYRKDPLNNGTASRLLERRETEEGADGSEARIARPDAGAALLLEVLEKRANERRIQILENQGGGRLAQSRLCKNEQQPIAPEASSPRAFPRDTSLQASGWQNDAGSRGRAAR
jgi:hypothetical protein